MSAHCSEFLLDLVFEFRNYTCLLRIMTTKIFFFCEVFTRHFQGLESFYIDNRFVIYSLSINYLFDIINWVTKFNFPDWKRIYFWSLIENFKVKCWFLIKVYVLKTVKSVGFISNVLLVNGFFGTSTEGLNWQRLLQKSTKISFPPDKKKF